MAVCALCFALAVYKEKTIINMKVCTCVYTYVATYNNVVTCISTIYIFINLHTYVRMYVHTVVHAYTVDIVYVCITFTPKIKG